MELKFAPNIFVLFFVSIFLLTLSCVTVKPFQLIAHQQENMKLNARDIQKMELNALSYREGSSGANGGKSGGGCGCN